MQARGLGGGSVSGLDDGRKMCAGGRKWGSIGRRDWAKPDGETLPIGPARIEASSSLLFLGYFTQDIVVFIHRA